MLPTGHSTQEEFEAVMLPRHGSGLGMTARRGGADNRKKHASAELPYERLAPKGRIPTSVDWRGTGADGIVKDQVPFFSQCVHVLIPSAALDHYHEKGMSGICR